MINSYEVDMLTVVYDIDKLKEEMRSKSWEGSLSPESEQTVSLAGVLELIDKYTIQIM